MVEVQHGRDIGDQVTVKDGVNVRNKGPVRTGSRSGGEEGWEASNVNPIEIEQDSETE